MNDLIYFRFMKKTFLLLIITFLLSNSELLSQNSYFPPNNASNWETIPPGQLGYCTDKIDSLYTFLENSNSKAFILLQDGKIVLEKYFGTFTSDSSWYWASAGKSLTAFLVGIAQRENHFSITDTSSKYLGVGWTNLSSNQEEKITIWNQLSMTTGLDDGVADHYCTIDTCLNYKADAGTRWAYHNGPYTLLDKIMENSTGANLNNYMNQKLSSSTGITGLFLPSGYNNLFFSKPRSMARFGLLMLNKGIWNGTDVLQDSNYFSNMINSSQNLNKSYGYLWWLNGKESYMLPSLQLVIPGSISPNAPSDMYAALGKNGQIINVAPSKNLVWIRMGNDPGVGEVPTAFNDEVWKKINNLTCTVNSKELKQVNHTSIYPNPFKQELNIINIGDQTISQVTIYNNINQVVYNLQSYNSQLNVNTSSFPAGTYHVKITGEDGKSTHQQVIKLN